ncbi:MAG: D-inositol-3-phosphate glycosyltransferase [Saprospiraceae bacterium]|nr:D-inositol-3-phosphate glycosyltransferase [Saprospiraceae bacterium]
MKRTLVFLNSHPVQYFAPMYQKIEKSGFFDLQVWYCSKHGLAGETDRQFGVSVKWDVPILEGYKHRFLSNISPRPSVYSFAGLINPGIVSLLWKLPKKSIIIVHGWNYITHWLAFFFAPLFGHTLCLRAESPFIHEAGKSGLKHCLRNTALRGIFRRINRFLYIGTQNRLFYQHFGIRDGQLIHTPYSIDNQRFQNEAAKLLPQKKALRRQLSLPEDAFIVLFTGKFIAKKRPLDLLKALAQIQDTRVVAVFVGEGVLRADMEHFIRDCHLEKRVFLTGFVNQTLIPHYYAVADTFAMCSEKGETWGLSTNEAMNFGLPVILSDQTGCAADLVEEGKSGFVFRSGDLMDLAHKISLIAAMSGEEREKMSIASKAKIAGYSYQSVIAGLRKI